MAKLAQVCSKCGAISSAEARQVNLVGFVSWSLEFECTACGCTWVACGHGWEIPEDWRQALLEEGGLWKLSIAATGPELFRAIKALRDELGWSMEETRRAKARAAEELARGTRAEMDFLCGLLARHGAVVLVSRVQGDANESSK